MRRRIPTFTLRAAALCLALAALLPASASAAPKPALTLTMTPIPANFTPGGTGEYVAVATNVGAAPTSGPITFEASLPAGLTPKTAAYRNSDPTSEGETLCPIVGQVVKCEAAEALPAGRRLTIQISAGATATPGVLVASASVGGGGAAQQAAVTVPTHVQAEPVPFDFLPGFQAPLTNEDGSAAVLAGSHPYQQTIDFGFPTKNPGDGITNAGHPRNVSVELPRGLVGSPAASPVLCTEAELTSLKDCPPESQVGVTDVTSLVGAVGGNAIFTTPLYNMVPPPGAVAEIATDVAGQGIFSHVLIGVRTDDDYGVEAALHDVIAFGQQPIFNVQAQIWGNPSDPAHNDIRGNCAESEGPCPPVDPQPTALLTMPGHCSGEPLPFKVFADTWEEPAPPFEPYEAAYESAELGGDPAVMADCGGLKFEPQIEARPTTSLTDSSSGLDFTLHQPQDTDFDSRATASLRDATVTFPAGMAVNPSQAAGLGACSEEQVDFLGEEAGVLRFSKVSQSCPDAAKIGTLEVRSPALVRRNAAQEIEETPEGDPILEPLKGSVYIAQPFDNPFGSLIAVYLVVEDEKTGIVAKLAGEGQLDPATGQVSTRFEENPELPFEDVKVHIFGGARGALITPPTCGEHTAAAQLTPWSAPEGKDALPSDAFALGQTPVGGACPTTEAQLPSAPAFNAGSEIPTAGAYSPLLFSLSRGDGTQRFSVIDAKLPTGLAAKLAGVGQCSEAQIAVAISREVPQKGALEQVDPSCPAASEIGTAIAAAGAGPTPYRTTGKVYLAGPYKGAPLSTVAIAPAVAGPFDLGTVVVRAALYLDPATAQGRVVTDPLPQILHGVPVDLRSVAIRVDRPNFALNPTSCAEKSFGGSVTSPLGGSAPLAQRFQVGGCESLPYKPKLTAKLFGPIHRGGHPRLRTVFTAKGGEANTRAISFTFPKSEFIDQAHFRTICTRVQFAANQCPPGSIYGHVRAFSPLLDYPLEGPVYLRSSSHKLPDAVLALHGPPHQPLFLEAAGRVDSVGGGLRVRFESVPDAPISKVVLTQQGGRKGLFQNSTNICKGVHRATLSLDAHNGKVHDQKPQLKAQCGGKGKGKKGGKGKGGGKR